MKRVVLLGALLLGGCSDLSPTGIDEQEIGDSGGVKGIYASDARSEGAMAAIQFAGNEFSGLLCVTGDCSDDQLVLVTGKARFNPVTRTHPDRAGIMRIDASFVAGVDPDATCPALSDKVYAGPSCAPLEVRVTLERDGTLWLPDLCDGSAYDVTYVPQDSATAN